MMQRRPNPTELRSMNSYNQILCRFPPVNNAYLLVLSKAIKKVNIAEKPHCCNGVVDHLDPVNLQDEK